MNRLASEGFIRLKPPQYDTTYEPKLVAEYAHVSTVDRIFEYEDGQILVHFKQSDSKGLLMYNVREALVDDD